MKDYEGLSKTAMSLLGLQLGSRQLDAFAWYASELRAWNQRFNLTAVTDPDGIEVKHFLDSLTCLLGFGGRPTGRVVDIGTGAGFPGLALKIVCPRMDLTVIEANGKKAEFCRHVIKTLGMESTEVLHARAEEIGQLPEYRQQFDWALARAVAQMPVLVEYLLPLLRLGGRAIAQKGETGPAEVQAAETALGILGGRIGQLIRVELPGVVESRYLVLIEKVAATPAAYPRRPGMPTKRPLGVRSEGAMGEGEGVDTQVGGVTSEG